MMRFRPELALLRSQLRGLARHGYALGGEIGPTLHSLRALIDGSIESKSERERRVLSAWWVETLEMVLSRRLGLHPSQE